MNLLRRTCDRRYKRTPRGHSARHVEAPEWGSTSMRRLYQGSSPKEWASRPPVTVGSPPSKLRGFPRTGWSSTTRTTAEVGTFPSSSTKRQQLRRTDRIRGSIPGGQRLSLLERHSCRLGSMSARSLDSLVSSMGTPWHHVDSQTTLTMTMGAMSVWVYLAHTVKSQISHEGL